MSDLDITVSLAEREILKKIEEGFFDDLKLKGKKISYHSSLSIPSEWRLLKSLSEGMKVLPPEIEIHQKIKELLKLYNEEDDNLKKKEIARQLSLLEVSLKLKLEQLNK